MKLPVPSTVLWSGIFEGRVSPLSRPRRSGVRIYQPLDDQREIRAWMSTKRPTLPFICDVWVDCLFIFKGHTKADLDNLLKAVNDGLQSSGIIKNDRQVIGGSFMKVISDHDETQIKIREAVLYDPSKISAGSGRRRIRRSQITQKSRGRTAHGKRKEPCRDDAD